MYIVFTIIIFFLDLIGFVLHSNLDKRKKRQKKNIFVKYIFACRNAPAYIKISHIISIFLIITNIIVQIFSFVFPNSLVLLCEIYIAFNISWLVYMFEFKVSTSLILQAEDCKEPIKQMFLYIISLIIIVLGFIAEIYIILSLV